MGLRLLVYEGNPKAGESALRSSWAVGARLYRSLGRVDRFLGARSWPEALAWCLSHEAPIAELQFWGHGRWGQALLGDEALSLSSLAGGHPHRAPLTALRGRLLPNGESLIWFRTCETFGSTHGHAFARTLTRDLRARAAGHTFVIGALQSGLHGLRPGAEPGWSATEGVERGTADRPEKALSSSVGASNTVHFLTPSVPAGWFD